MKILDHQSSQQLKIFLGIICLILGEMNPFWTLQKHHLLQPLGKLVATFGLRFASRMTSVKKTLIDWIYPPTQDSSHYQEYYIFSKELL